MGKNYYAARAHSAGFDCGDLPAMMVPLTAEIRFKGTRKAMAARVVHVWEMEDRKGVSFERFADAKLVDEATKYR